jgi:hypothetical protein
MSETVTIPEVQYETDLIKLGLYWSGEGSPFPEETLVTLFLKTKKQGLLARSFPSMGKNVTLNKFVSYLSTRPLVFGVDKVKGEVVGYAYLAEEQIAKCGRKAHGGFVIFKEFWGSSYLRNFCKLVLHYWFVELKIDVLYGTVDARNKLALKFDEALRFKIVGRLPKFLITDDGFHDAIIVVLEREDFLSNFGAY